MYAISPRQFVRNIEPDDAIRAQQEARLAKLLELDAPSVIVANQRRLIEMWTSGFQMYDNILYSDGVTFTIKLSNNSDSGSQVIAIIRQWMSEKQLASGDLTSLTKIIVIGSVYGMIYSQDFPGHYSAFKEPDTKKLASDELEFVLSKLPKDLKKNLDFLGALKNFLGWAH